MKICIVPDKSKLGGGPATFQRKLTGELRRRGLKVTCDLDDEPYDTILVINCIRQVHKLLSLKRRGIRIVQRLGIPNRLHRYLKVGLKGYLLREFWNINMRFIRSVVADHIVYQSEYTQRVWEEKFGRPRVGTSVIYNGVELEHFCPQGDRYRSRSNVCIISVEGAQGTDPYDIAVNLGRQLVDNGVDLELLMFGKAWENAKARFVQYPFVNFVGQVNNAVLPQFYRGAHFLISTDIITAACPNSVIESLACGTPVLGYKVEPLPEIVDAEAGQCVELESCVWKGEAPGNFEELVKGAFVLLERQARFRYAARVLAKNRYGLKKMVDSYIDVLVGNAGK